MLFKNYVIDFNGQICVLKMVVLRDVIRKINKLGKKQFNPRIINNFVRVLGKVNNFLLTRRYSLLEILNKSLVGW